MFEQVCILLSERMKKQQPIFPISVNLSRRHFKDPDFLSVFQQTAQRYQVPAEWIEFELTESLFFDDQGIETVKRQIDEMHRMGFRCSLDDFGMGYSSLGLLMEFEVDVIKLDKRFFLNVNRKKTRDVVTCVVNLSKQLHAEVVAEGIESEEQLEFLRATGCEIVQGYIFSKPLSLEDFECWLSDHQ